MNYLNTPLHNVGGMHSVEVVVLLVMLRILAYRIHSFFHLMSMDWVPIICQAYSLIVITIYLVVLYSTVKETVLHFRSLIFNLVWKINSMGTETRRLKVKTQMMTIIVGIEMERVTSIYMQKAKATGLGGYLAVKNKGEDGVKDDHQVSVLGDREQLGITFLDSSGT